MKHIKIKSCRAEELRDLRHQLLVAHLPKSRTIFPHDDLHHAQHIAAYDGKKQIAIVSIHQENLEKISGVNNLSPFSDKQGWRIRGMAVAESYRRQGVGKLLITHLKQAVFTGDPKQYIWCNARLVALNFYAALGFQQVGEQFEVKDIGPHYIMYFIKN